MTQTHTHPHTLAMRPMCKQQHICSKISTQARAQQPREHRGQMIAHAHTSRYCERARSQFTFSPPARHRRSWPQKKYFANLRRGKRARFADAHTHTAHLGRTVRTSGMRHCKWPNRKYACAGGRSSRVLHTLRATSLSRACATRKAQ